MCLLCDKNIPRDKFKNINQIETDEYTLALLGQIQHSQVEINSMIKNMNNEKISIITNIHAMADDKFEWNSNFDIVYFNFANSDI